MVKKSPKTNVSGANNAVTDFVKATSHQKGKKDEVSDGMIP